MEMVFKQYEREFLIYCDELLKWGRIHNITGYRDKSSIVKNILDSIAPLDFIDDFKIVLDIGSGCGFPAIPLAIVKKDRHFILLEPNNKRVAFLKILTIKLGLNNVVILKEKIEHINKAHLDSLLKPLGAESSDIDLITSRAFCKTEALIAISKHLLNKNGAFLLYKGSGEFNKMDNKVHYLYTKKES